MYKEPTFTQYFAIFLFIAIALLIPVVALLFGRLLRPHKPNPVKQMPYECGMEPIGDARERYPVRYYIIALLFLIFDVETIFLFPWAVIYMGDTPAVVLFLFVEMAVFFAIVIVGYIYIWKKGALKWV
jgi:NADH-quinone oxidoreductase subunit A